MAELFLVPALETPARSIPRASPLADAFEREQALDISQSWIVEAPAGSGKTGLLIQRFLKLLLSENVTNPAQVLAITFTRKATSEMRDRVWSQLDAASKHTEPANAFDQAIRPLAAAVLARDRQLGWNLLEDPRRLTIRTIDSVCTDIARALPVLSGSGGGQTPTEDPSPLYAEAARRTVLQLGGSDAALSAALEELLLHRDGNLGNCEALLVSMLASRDQWGELVPLKKVDLNDHYLDEIVLPKLEKVLDLAICRSLTRLTRILPASILARLGSLASEMAYAEGYRGAVSPIAVCRDRGQSPREKTEDLDHWRALIHLLITHADPRNWRRSLTRDAVKFEILKHHGADLKQIIAELADTPGLFEELCLIQCLPPSKFPPEQWAVTKTLFRILSHALDELQIVFAERGTCDFAEIGLIAKTALRREEAQAGSYSSAAMNLQHLLVDEMQDTSSSQYELIQLLTRGWDGRAQTVFLVGDPKQSIYLFREARVERFVHTMLSGKLGAIPLGTLQLTANFRSQRNLVDACNHDFSLLFPAEADGTRAELVPFHPAAAAVRGPAPHADRVWHLAALPYSESASDRSASQSVQSTQNAAEIRSIVELWRARPLPPERSAPWKLAVLVRNRTHLLHLVRAFKEQPSIPFRAIDIEPLGERQEILDLLALTRALLHPADRTAWLALLRAPWCGLTLADLHLLAGKDDAAWSRQTIVECMHASGDLLSEDGIARLQPFWSVMDAALKQRGQLPLSLWVERTWQAFRAHVFADQEVLANVERFLRLLDKLETSVGVLSLPRLTAQIKRLYAAPALLPGAVDLMTIHAAKGLEWDVVFVPALEKTSKTSAGRLLAWLEVDGVDKGPGEAFAHGIFAPIQSKGTASHDLTKWMRSVDASRESAERQRLLYVAATRAREELHLFAAPLRKKNGSVAVPPQSLLSSAWPAVAPLFEPDALERLQEGKGLQEAAICSPTEPATQLHLNLFDLAATSSGRHPAIDRIPLLKAASPDSSPPSPPPAAKAVFLRPAGSFSARGFGNTMHAFLDLLARRIAEGTTIPELLAEVATWSGRVAAVLRANGLAPADVDRLSAGILKGLGNTLADRDGQWILAAHPGAASENALQSANEERSSVRLDRTFLAGSRPQSFGSGYRWIVDYKTASHGKEGLSTFLEAELQLYREQLQTYAQHLSGEGLPIRLALFYPMLPKLVWFEAITP